jgi:hypothetical protein
MLWAAAWQARASMVGLCRASDTSG